MGLTAAPHVPHRLSVACNVIVKVSLYAFALSADHIELRSGRINGLGDQGTACCEKTLDEHVHVFTDLDQPRDGGNHLISARLSV